MLTGTVPPSMTQLTELTVFNVADNKLHGEFPVEMFNMPKIFRLDLSDNGFYFKFPPSVSPRIMRMYVHTAVKRWFRTCIELFLRYVISRVASGLKINGPMPSMNWTIVDSLYAHSLASHQSLHVPELRLIFLITAHFLILALLARFRNR